MNVNYRYVEEELRYLLHDTDAVAVVFHAEFVPTLARLATVTCRSLSERRRGRPRLRFRATVRGRPSSTRPRSGRIAAWRDFGPRSADDLYILYTGGTTGMPKGVMWRAEDIFFGGLGGGNLGEAPITKPEEITEQLDAGRRTLPACPFMHGTAHWLAFGTLYSGGTVVISPDRRLDPARLWELIAREQVTFLVIVGDAFARPLVEALDTLDPSLDLSSLTVVLSGGAILSPSVKQLWVQKLPGTILIDGFGSSESGGQGQSVTAAGGPIETAPRFRVDPETTVLDDDLKQAPAGVVGKLARRGHVPVGYYKDPVKTAATFPVVDGVRWSVPGDHARIEDDGTITVLGRGSVSINTGGEKVYPEEVESALKSHLPVFDAVVVGVPDERWGERVTAWCRRGRAPCRSSTISPSTPARISPRTRCRASSCSSTRSCGRRRANPTTAGPAPPPSPRRPARSLHGVNRLADETSPYLRQHADNPVDWYPWGDEAFARARADDKPILLSVGYSACHWCHVMAHESFEDATSPR